MRNFTKFGILFLILSVFGSCASRKNNKNKSKSPEIKSVTVKPGYVIPKTNGDFKINTANIEGDILTLEISYTGGCESHSFDAYASNMYLKSMPPKLGIFILHTTNDDACEIMITETIKFDLKNIKYPGTDKDYTLMINLNNWKGSLAYKY